MAKTGGRDAGMEAKGCGTTGACATLNPKHRSQPQWAEVCSDPCGQGSSRTHSPALCGWTCWTPSVAATSNWVCPPKNSLGLLSFFAHRLVNSPAPSKHQRLIPGGFEGSPFVGTWQQRSECIWG